MKTNREKTATIALTALFFATALTLSFLESLIPPVAWFPPGVKLGLSNVAVMYALLFIGSRQALTIAVLKAGFVFLMRGPMGGFLSLSGGLGSIIIMWLLLRLIKNPSYMILSIGGGVCHNLGQFIAISLIFGGHVPTFYLAPLIVGGVLAGVATATVLRFILPALQRRDLNLSNQLVKSADKTNSGSE